MSDKINLTSLLENNRQLHERTRQKKPELRREQLGRVEHVGEGIASVSGLSECQADALLQFTGNKLGFAFNLDPEAIGVILLDDHESIPVGSRVRDTNRILDVPVGDAMVGRVVDPLGRPLDGKPKPQTNQRLGIEQQAPDIIDRLPVEVPLQTGLKVVDALIPIGRGQRELILGDRQTGKTAIALDTIINQRDTEVLCIYCAIGQKGSDVAKFISQLKANGAMQHSIIVAANGDDPPGLQYAAPYAATSMGEFFMRKGRDVLVVYDDLTKHARAYRELSLLLRRPPAREAYPGDIFYIHSRLLERATHLKDEKGGGSLSALPIVETQAQNISAYIPTNLISITDGQIYVSPQLFRKGILPAVDVGESVSRVGGKTQLKAYRDIAGDLRLSYSQFEELETFARFSSRLDEETRQKLNRGEHVRQSLKQSQYQPIPVPEQIAVLLSVSEGLFDDLDIDKVPAAEQRIREAMREQLPDVGERILSGKTLSDEDKDKIKNTANQAIAELKETDDNGNA